MRLKKKANRWGNQSDNQADKIPLSSILIFSFIALSIIIGTVLFLYNRVTDSSIGEYYEYQKNGEITHDLPVTQPTSPEPDDYEQQRDTDIMKEYDTVEITEDESILEGLDSYGEYAVFPNGKDEAWLHDESTLNNVPNIRELVDKCNEELFTSNSWTKNRSIDCVKSDSDLSKLWPMEKVSLQPYYHEDKNNLNRAWSTADVLEVIYYAYDPVQEKIILTADISREFYEAGKLLDDSGNPTEARWQGGSYSYVQLWEKENGEWKLSAIADNGSK